VRPDARVVASFKLAKKSQQNASQFLMSVGFPAVTKAEWEKIPQEIVEDAGLARQLVEKIPHSRDLTVVLDKILRSEKTVSAILALMVLGKSNASIARTLTRSGLGEFTERQIETFRYFFFDLNLCDERELSAFVERLSEKYREAVEKAKSAGTVSFLVEMGLVPDVAAEDYLHAVVATAFKTLQDIALGKIKLQDPIAIVHAGLKAAEVLGKSSQDAAKELVETLRQMIEIQTVEDTDKSFGELE